MQRGITKGRVMGCTTLVLSAVGAVSPSYCPSQDRSVHRFSLLPLLALPTLMIKNFSF